MKTTAHLFLAFLILSFVSCGQKQPTAAERRAEKHRQDSIALTEQERSLAYYDSLYQTLLPVADSLIKEFRYEKNEKYEQDKAVFTAIYPRVCTDLPPGMRTLRIPCKP